jgi:hypothetical protein
MLKATHGDHELSSERHLRRRYVLLTAALFFPLLLAFFFSRNVYPVASWTVMMSGGSLQRPWTYYVVRGETIRGEIVDIHPPHLTNALYGRNWSLVRATIDNESFKLRSPHPQNAALLRSYESLDKLPQGVRVPELLQAWGQLYNRRLPHSSPSRLKAVRIDVYRWDSGGFQNYDRFIETWRQEL